MSKHVKILVLGHARCGTGYSAQLLKSYGFDIGHECYGKDGISAWPQVPIFEKNKKLKTPWGPPRHNKDTYDILIHNIRDPIDAIDSIFLHNKCAKAYKFIRKTIINQLDIDIEKIENELDRAVASYVYWNSLIEKQNPDIRIRVEKDQEILFDFLNGKFKKKVKINKVRLPSKNYNGRKKTNQDLSKISPKYMEMIDMMCVRYGYEKVSTRI